MLMDIVRVLFAISVVCFCTVLWIALSLARRLRIAQNKENRRLQQTTATEFFEAGEFRTPRPIRLNQEIRSKYRQTTAEFEADAQPKRSLPETLAPAHRSGLQLVATAKVKLEAVPNSVPLHAETTNSGENMERRKSPQPSRASGFRRVDLSHYNQDMGDLTDPYTHPLRGSGTQGSTSKKN